MKFHDFIESTYVSTNISLQQEFSPQKQAKTLACQELINGQRRALKWVSFVSLLFSYILVQCRIKTAPLTSNALITQYKIAAQKAMEEASKPVVSLAPSPEPEVASVANPIPEALNPKAQARAEAIKAEIAKAQAKSEKGE